MRDMKKPRPAGELLSLADVCERLAIHPLHVYALAYYGHLRTVMVGRRQKYLSWEVEALAHDPQTLRAVSFGRFLFDRLINAVA